MLILPPGHWQEISSPGTLGRRERWLIASGVALLAVICTAVVIALTSVHRTSANGCIDVSAATVIGGSELYRCGAEARSLCSHATASAGSSNVAFQRGLVDACRKAGLAAAAAPPSR